MIGLHALLSDSSTTTESLTWILRITIEFTVGAIKTAMDTEAAASNA